MTEPPTPATIDDDVAWVRRHLGPADPARWSDAAPATDPPTVVALRPAPAPPRHRARVVVAVTTAAALVGAVAAVVVASGGGSGPAGTRVVSGQPVFAAATATEAARTAQLSVTATVGPDVITVGGAVDLTAGNADVTTDLPMSLGTVEVRTVGRVAYIHLPANLQGVAGSTPWIETDLPTVDGLAAGQLGLPALGQGLDVTGLLDWLRGVSGAVTDVGTDTIHGITATHYRVQLDLAKAAAAAPAAAQAGLQQAAQAVGPTVPVDVWVDDQGRLVQLTTSVNPTGDGPGGSPVAVTVDLWDFGAPVVVTPPPADQVTNVPLGGALRGALGGRGLFGGQSSSGGGGGSGLGGQGTAVTPGS